MTSGRDGSGAAMTEEPSHVTMTEIDGVHVVRFRERKILEELSISEIGEELSALVDQKPGCKILLGFESRYLHHSSPARLEGLRGGKDASGHDKDRRIN